MNHKAKFMLNWLHRDNIRFAAFQLYGLLADLVLTGLLSLPASNKLLPGLKRVCSTSRKSSNALKVKFEKLK